MDLLMLLGSFGNPCSNSSNLLVSLWTAPWCQARSLMYRWLEKSTCGAANVLVGKSHISKICDWKRHRFSAEKKYHFLSNSSSGKNSCLFCTEVMPLSHSSHHKTLFCLNVYRKLTVIRRVLRCCFKCWPAFGHPHLSVCTHLAL